MTTYLYCLLPAASDPAAAAPPPGLTGVAGEHVRAIDADGLIAWVGTPAAASGTERDAETARRHDRVVRAALATGRTPLPARAGQAWPDDTALLAELRRRATDVRRTLEAVAGCVEVTVHAIVGPLAAPPEAASEGEAAPAGRGRAYLDRLRERQSLERFVQAEAARSATVIGSAVRDLSRGEAVVVRRDGEMRVRLAVSHLVASADVARHRAAIEALTAPPGLTIIRVAGPYPPYSFARLRPDG